MFTLITIGGQIVVAGQAANQPVGSSFSVLSKQMQQEYDLSSVTFADRLIQSTSNNQTTVSKVLMVRATVTEKMNKDQIAELCSQIFNEIQNQYPDLSQYEAINVTVNSGFNLGFVSFSTNAGQTFTLNK